MPGGLRLSPVRRLTVIAVALVALLAAVPAEGAKRRPLAKKQLTAFRSCDGLVTFAQRRTRRFGTDVFGTRRPFPVAAPTVSPVAGREQAAAGTGGPTADSAPQAAPVEGTDFSGTNVQEAGIDEPDAVKTDGRRLYIALEQKLHVLDLTGDTPTLVKSIPLEGYGHELFLHEGKLLVLTSTSFGGPIPVDNVAARPAQAQDAPASTGVAPEYYAPRAQLTEIKTSDLSVVRTLEVPGTIVGGRLRGSTARIAISIPTGVLPAEDAPLLRRWVPAMELNRPSTGTTVRRSVTPCAAIRRPEIFAGLGLLTVLTIDLDKGVDPVDSDAIMADASTVYASASRMYFATERWFDQQVLLDGVPPGRSTTIHAFDVTESDRTAYVGSGSVRGYVLNQFSLSEHRGALRVATTDDPPWLPTGPQGESESFVSVLDERDGRLVEVGRVGGLGRGERIYAVRFVGDIGFVVTFRQVDPLYTLDLSERANPRVVGELKIPGFSSYLHPIGDDLVIGVGQDADTNGRTRGAQVSLFDVSDLSDPRRLQQRSLGSYAYTQAEHDHHAFLWWGPTKLLVLPFSDYDPNGASFTGATGMHVERTGITEVGRTQHPEQDGYEWPIVRALVVGNRVLTISGLGVQAGRLDTLAGTAWIPFGA